MWPIYGGQNGSKSIVSVAPKAELWTPLGLFGQSLHAGLWPFVNEKGRVRSSPVRPKRGDLKVRTLPTTMIQALAPFAPLFSKSASGVMFRCFWREPYSLRARGP